MQFGSQPSGDACNVESSGAFDVFDVFDVPMFGGDPNSVLRVWPHGIIALKQVRKAHKHMIIYEWQVKFPFTG